MSASDMILTLYQCKSDRRKVGKTYSEIATLSDIKIKDDTHLLKPVFTFRKFENWKNFNYAKLEWGQMTPHYYFVKDPVISPGGIVSIECECDPYETWKTYIKGLYTMVTRQENVYNPILFDSKANIPGSRVYKGINCGTVGTTAGSIILTVSG